MLYAESVSMGNRDKTDTSSLSYELARPCPIDEDFPFQRRQWVAERIGWLVMVALLACAVAGVFGGGGPLARTAASGADGGRVQYARFARHSSPTSLDINVPPSNERQVRVRISGDYLSAVHLQTITPPPTSTSVGDRQHILVFDRAYKSSGTTIRFELEPKAVGVNHGWVAIDGGSPISFSQFVYP